MARTVRLGRHLLHGDFLVVGLGAQPALEGIAGFVQYGTSDATGHPGVYALEADRLGAWFGAARTAETDPVQ